MRDIEDDRKLVEAIRRERGGLTRNELCRKYGIYQNRLDRLIRQYELQTRTMPGAPIPRPYNVAIAKRQLAAEVAAAKAERDTVPPYKGGWPA